MPAAATIDEVRRAACRTYQPYGAAWELMRDASDEVMMSGPAGTGKSRACLELLYALAMHHPGMRGLMVRKTRESLTEAALVTWEEKVIPQGDPMLRGASRRLRQSYDFPNGSTIVVGGLDKASKVMSTEYDVIYVQEAIEITENDWESLTTRVRNGVIPGRQQVFGDTNPDKPTHWLKKRCDKGLTKIIECRHTDNPVLYDHVTKTWTPAGVGYLAKLDRLTGPRKLRLRDGRWVQAEGVVYDGWDAAIHLIDRFAIPEDWRRVLSIDFGWTNPFVAQFWAIDPDGRMYLYREIYRSQRLVEDHAADLLRIIEADGVPISGIVCDHDAEGRATLMRHMQRANFPAVKTVREGIQAVAARLRVHEDGRPRLFIMRDTVEERDPRMKELEKPCSTAEEIDGYVWDTKKAKLRGEEPVKEDDHGMDCMRYAVQFVDAGAGRWDVGGSDPAEAAVNRLPAGTFADPRPVESTMGDIMSKRF